jgi:hypothetical protein
MVSPTPSQPQENDMSRNFTRMVTALTEPAPSAPTNRIGGR